MIRYAGRFLLSVIAGYAVMVLLITLVQEGMFGGVSFHTTPTSHLLAAGVLTLAAAFAGGVVAAKCFGSPYFPPALAMCGLVILETTIMILAGRLEGPVWFDVMAASSLLVGILGGAIAVRRGIFANRLRSPERNAQT